MEKVVLLCYLLLQFYILQDIRDKINNTVPIKEHMLIVRL